MLLKKLSCCIGKIVLNIKEKNLFLHYIETQKTREREMLTKKIHATQKFLTHIITAPLPQPPIMTYWSAHYAKSTAGAFLPYFSLFTIILFQ